MTANKIPSHQPLETDVADKLLDLLSSDDDFRDLFQRDPTAALAQAGHVPALDLMASGGDYSSNAFACMTTVEIASKEQIGGARDTLRETLTSKGSHTDPHRFDAGNIDHLA
ncbi:NHLP-related RiPP peptide [Lysobacter cavernae]|uniref:NHLP-related RiPP peptide n=1 Tax=Lysobacter cavernae TaxID=1685901 RepID=A0ABV7RUL8_9GAMM